MLKIPSRLRFLSRYLEYAGKYIKNPAYLADGTHITVYLKGSDNWWEHGEKYTSRNGVPYIDCGDGNHVLDEWDVYLDSRY